MSQRKFILIIAVLTILGGAVWLAVCCARIPREPIYHGKGLSVWLGDQYPIDGRIVLADESVRAVQAIGTNAIPYLLATLDSPAPSQTKLWLGRFLGKHGFDRPPTSEWFYNWFHDGSTRRRQAMYGFRALGLESRPAIPKIVKLVLYSSDDGTRCDAINALTGADKEAITLIAQGLDNPDREIRVRAAFALGCLRQAPPIAVPALAKALSDPDAEVRAGAVGSLGTYQEYARPMVSQITTLLSDTNGRVSSCVAEALKLIEPKSVPPTLP